MAGGPVGSLRLGGDLPDPLPAGWTFAGTNVRNGWSRFTLDHDRAGPAALVVRLDPICDISGAVRQPSDRPATQRYERSRSGSSVGAATWYTVIPGGCFTARFDPTGDAGSAVVDEAKSVVDFVTRAQLDRTLAARSNGRLHLDP